MERRVRPYVTLLVLDVASLAGAAATVLFAAEGEAVLGEVAVWLAGVVIFTGLLGGMAVRDIRRLRRDASGVARLKAALEEALDRMPDGLAMYDRDLRLIWCNYAYRRLLGPVGDSLAPGDALPELLASDARETDMESGRRIAVDLVELDSGIILSILRDATGEKEAAARERALRERFRLHLSAAGGWTWESDVLNRFTILNPVRPEIDPADLEWLVGRHLYELVPAGIGSSSALESCLRDMAMQRRIREVTLWLHDGRRLRSVRLSGAPRFDSGGNFLGYSGVGSFAAAGILPETPPRRALSEAKPSSEPSRRTPAAPAERPHKLLVAEDSQTNRLLAQSILERMGYQVDTVENGRQAVKAVRNGEYGAVLMDVLMPEMDGLKATAEIRALAAPKSGIPVIAMTAHASADDRQRCIDAGMDEHVAKPIDRARLADILNELLGSRAGDRPDAQEVPKKRGAKPAGRKKQGAKPVAPKKNDAKSGVSVPRLVDESIIAELKEDAGEPLVDELISTYMSETNDRLERMGAALKDGRLEDIGADAHAMKSSSGTFGALRLEALAAQLEAASTGHDGERTAALMEALPGLVSETWAALGAQGHTIGDSGTGE